MNSNLFILCVLYILPCMLSFPVNLTPLTNINDVPRRVFVGDDPTQTNLAHVQFMKAFTFGSVRRVVIAAREKLYLLDPESFTAISDSENMKHTEMFAWNSNKETIDLCHKKGQPKELCFNFLSILHLTNNGDLVICGTNSYSPECFINKVSVKANQITLKKKGNSKSGRHISPFGPNQSSASIFTAQSLFSASYQSIFGGSPIITRTMGPNEPLRTDANPHLIKDAEFIKMTEDNDRVLIFFNEQETLPSGDRRTVSQVAQVCKNDVGGTRILEQMFTTFLKSRLNCSYNGFYLNQLKDVTDPIIIGEDSIVFATFSTPDNSLPGSAVCAFKLSSIHSSMSGPFLINNDETSESRKSIPPASRHPGKCGKEKLNDPELVFIKYHPQMEKQTAGSLLLTNQGQRWTAIAVDVKAGPRNNTVIYVGTNDGHLIRSLPPVHGQTISSGVVISNEMVFDEQKCSSSLSSRELLQEDRQVQSILIQDDVILVAFKHCIVSVPLRMCMKYSCKSACLKSSNPYCGWNGKDCVPFLRKDQNLRQDLRSSKIIPPCSDESELDELDHDDQTFTTQPFLNQDFDPNGSDTVVGRGPDEQKEYSLETLIIVVCVTFVLTVVLLFVVLLTCCRCRRQRSEDLKQKQFEEQHIMAVASDSKRSSLSRRMKRTYCGWTFLFRKVTTPLHSPEVGQETRQTRHQNNYSEPPKKHWDCSLVKQKSSSRLNSISSTTSRQDSIRFALHSQPLIPQNPPNDISDETLPKHISEQSTLPLSLKPIRDSTASVRDSYSSGASPVFPENGSGAAETGILPTASTKLRRRNEQAEQRTSEIMKDSDSAIQQTEHVLLRMEKIQAAGGLNNSLPHMRLSPNRCRIDSQDSGRGDSCRSSLKPELEQNFIVPGSQSQRRNALGYQRTGPRRRLKSEGSYSNDGMPAGETFYPEERKRRLSGNSSSQAETPVDEKYHMLSPMNTHQPIFNSGNYGTWSKGDKLTNEIGREFQNQQKLAEMQRSYHPSPQNFSSPNFYPHQPSEPHIKRALVDFPIPVTAPYSSPSKHPVNFYPSLQIRGSHAQKTFVTSNYPVEQIKRSGKPPQQIYYPPSMYPGHPRNSVGVIERKAIGRDQPPNSHSIGRHASMPASTKPIVRVSPIRGGAV